MTRQKTLLIILTLLFIAVAAFGVGPAFADLKLPQPTGYVNDFAGMLSPSTVSDLNGKLSEFEKKTGNEIAVATVKDLQGTTVEDFAVRLFENWKIGKKGKDNGVLLLISKDERKVRIEVGYGLEPNLTDAQSYNIIHNVITPKFKAGDYDQGIIAGVDGITKTISGEAPPAVDPQPFEGSRHRGRSFGGFIYLGLFLILGAFQWLVSILGRTKSWWLGGVLGGLAGLAVMLFSVIAGAIAMAVFVPVGLLFDFIVSRAYEARAKHPNDRNAASPIPWWAGGYWGPGGGFGGGSGGSGFGGFGGGESGGGGSSGDW